MKVLVTGGAGFIGSHLVERLLEDGVEVVCLDDFNDFYDPRIKWENLSRCLNHPRFRVVQGDIRNKELVEELFGKEAFEKVVHLAARAGVRQSLEDPLLYEDVNVRGTLNLLEASKGKALKKFVFGSSSSVYGINAKVPFSEDDRVDQPISPYAATKIAGERLCFAYHHLYGIPMVCLRFFTVYGPRQRPEMAIHRFTRMISEGKAIPLYGNGESSRDYTYVSDIVDGILAAMDLARGFQVFNLGDFKIVDLTRLVSLIEGALGRKAKIEKLPPQAGDVSVTLADITEARERLGYHPAVSIEEGIGRFVDWWKTRNGK